jgi:hypothetical protein
MARASGTRPDLGLLLTESVRVHEAANSWAELTEDEGVRVRELLTAVRREASGLEPALTVQLLEHLSARDRGATQIGPVPIRVTDGPLVAVLDAPGLAPALAARLTEGVRVHEAANSWAELTEDEGVRVVEVLAAALRETPGPEPALAVRLTETVRVRRQLVARRRRRGW